MGRNAQFYVEKGVESKQSLCSEGNICPGQALEDVMAITMRLV